MTIPAGTTVTVGEGSTLTGTGQVVVQGTLNVLGTPSAVVAATGLGFDVRSGGALTVSNATLTDGPTALTVAPGAGNVSFYKVVVTGASNAFSIRGGTVLIDHSEFHTDSGANISGAGVVPEIRHSVLDSGGPNAPDFLVIGNGGGVNAHHNLFEASHCAIHTGGQLGELTFEYNIFNGSSYAIMMYGAGTAQMHHNEIRSVASRDVFHTQRADSFVDATDNHFTAGCPADGARCPGGGPNACKITYQPCASGPVAGVGPQP